jgi:DNA-binding winged helix-turn-helix (wHTH) protein/tetratricopeptide (TPR) repeat protein
VTSSDADTAEADREIRLAREPRFRLGAVEVRPATREVIAPAGQTILEPRAMQVLVALAQARGGIVDRDALIARCWSGRAVGEDAISRVISQLRKLGDDLGGDGWTLDTITKVGYRLLPLGGAAPEPEDPTIAAPAKPPPRRLFLGAAAGAAATAVVGGGLWWTLRPRPMPPQARALYEKGQEALRQGLPEQIAQAVGFLRQAVAQAPDDARAWGALALAYQASLTYTPPARQDGVNAQAQAAARRALELDRNDPDGAAALAILTPYYRNWAAADRLYEHALRVHPRQPALQAAYAKLLLSVGRQGAAVKAAQTAVAEDGFSPMYHHALARSLWSAGRTEEAEQVLGKALGLWPRHYALWFLQVYLLAHTGRADEAIAFALDEARRPAGIPPANFDLALMSARAVRSRAPADVEAAVAANAAAARTGAGFAEAAISWMATLGRPDEAFRIARGLYFDEGFALGGQRYTSEQGRFMVAGGRGRETVTLFMPPAAVLRRDPRFGVLVRDLGIADYWRGAGHGPDDRELVRLAAA